MKKYFFAIAAIALAIGFSAFTTPKKSSKNLNSYYWYEVDASGFLVAGPSDFIDIDDARDVAPCQDDGEQVCFIGNSSNSLATDGSVDYHTLPQEEDNLIYRIEE